MKYHILLTVLALGTAIVLLHFLVFRYDKSLASDGPKLGQMWRCISFRFPATQRKRFWKFMDYVWLTFAAVGLFSAVGAVERYDAEQSLRRVNQSLEATLISILDVQKRNLGRGTNPLCGLWPPTPACAWLFRVNEEIDKAKGLTNWPLVANPKWSALFDRAQTLIDDGYTDPGDLRNVVLAIKDSLKKANDLTQEASQYANRVRRDSLEEWFFRLWPVILVAALSIRCTKATAEILLEKS